MPHPTFSSGEEQLSFLQISLPSRQFEMHPLRNHKRTIKNFVMYYLLFKL